MSQARVLLPIFITEISPIPASLEWVSGSKRYGNSADNLYRLIHRNERSHGPFNAWDLLDEFLTWDVDEWHVFFYMAGSFGFPHFRIAQKDFKEWQLLLREAMVRPSKRWEALRKEFDPRKVSKLFGTLSIQFEWNAPVPTARLCPLNALEAMISAIQIDKLQGNEFRVCARRDCKKPPFRVGTRQKIYCCSDCAHLVAVRESRKRKAESKESE